MPPELLSIAMVRRLAANGSARAIREAAGLSISEVARDLGVTPSAVSRWERGLRRPHGQPATDYLKILEGLSGR